MAESPTELAKPDPRPGPRLKLEDFKRAFKRFQKDQMGDHAASLTYYALLSLFPGLLFAVALLGFVGQEGLIESAAESLRDAGAPEDTVSAVTNALDTALSQRGAAFTALIIGLVTGLNGASGYFAAIGRGLNVIWRVEEGRGFVKRKLNDLGWTLLVIVLVLVAAILIFSGGGIAKSVFEAIGLGDTAATVWQFGRWPLAGLVAMLVYAVVFFAAPNVKVRRFQFVTPGAVFGVLLTLIASGVFFLYASNFSNYSATYGTFAGVVILLYWLWLANQVILFAAELNAVIDLRRSPELPDTYDGPPLPAKVPAEA